jgi:hypothetical protein
MFILKSPEESRLKDAERSSFSISFCTTTGYKPAES